MIDTIVLRIHDTLKYEHLIRHLDSQNVKGYTMETCTIDQGEINDLKRRGVKKPSEIIDLMRVNRTNDYIIKSKMADQPASSGHYNFIYHANYTANYLEFNFSIPKYLFGSNVLQFVDHYGEKYYAYSDCIHLDYNIERAYEKLIQFLDYLFKIEFPFDDINWEDVEVSRIDVCFNQVFRSKEEALRYMEYQKRLKKKYTRDEEGGGYREYATSLMYTTKRYAAKIYHKGTEYAKNDLKKHLKYNKEKKIQYFDVKQYQAFADRILRYELTIRTTMLNYLHKRNLFRKKCPDFQIYYRVFQAVETALQKNERIAKRIGLLPDKEKEAYKKEHPYVLIDKEKKKIYRWVSKILNQRTHFTLAVNKEVADYNRTIVNYECNEAKFSKGLLKLCLLKMKDFMEEFQIRELPDEEKVKKAIVAFNKEHRNKLPEQEMVWFYCQLKEIGSFKETARMHSLSRATLYRYKERFRKIGITENNIRPLTEEGVPMTGLDLADYHYEVSYNTGYLKPGANMMH